MCCAHSGACCLHDQVRLRKLLRCGSHEELFLEEDYDGITDIYAGIFYDDWRNTAEVYPAIQHRYLT